MTSRPIPAYGGVSFPREVLESVAEQINDGAIPFHVDHSLAKPVRIQNFEAFLERRDDGIDELRFRAVVHMDDLQLIESRPGVSVTVMAPLARDEVLAMGGSASLRLSADHAWFSDETLIEAEGRLIDRGIARDLVQVERAYQFSLIPDPQIFVEILYPLLQSIGSSAVWEAIKGIFGRRKTPKGGESETPTIINLSVMDGDRSLQAVVSTGDEAVAQRALASLDKLTTDFFQAPSISPRKDQRASISTWDVDGGGWTPPK